jgi:hypothetical protein
MKAALQNIGLLLASCLVTLGGIELGLRLFDPKATTSSDEYVLYIFDPVLGWANRPLLHAQFSRPEFSYPVATNALGMWDREVADKRGDEFRVAVLGDSFTWGWGVPYGQRFTEVVEDLDPQINALNFGVPGYGPLQYLLKLDQVLALKPDYVVVTFCLGNDLTDLLVSDTSPQPYGRLKEGSQLEIIGYPLPEPEAERAQGGPSFRIVGLLETALEMFGVTGLEVKGFENAPETIMYAPPERLASEHREMVAFVYQLDDAILEAMRKKIEAAIGRDRFAVLLAPTKYEYGQYLERWPGADPNAVANKMLASLARLKISALDGRDVIGLEDFWITDGHWRPSGHEKIGALLDRFLSKVISGNSPELSVGGALQNR